MVTKEQVAESVDAAAYRIVDGFNIFADHVMIALANERDRLASRNERLELACATFEESSAIALKDATAAETRAADAIAERDRLAAQVAEWRSQAFWARRERDATIEEMARLAAQVAECVALLSATARGEQCEIAEGTSDEDFDRTCMDQLDDDGNVDLSLGKCWEHRRRAFIAKLTGKDTTP